MISGITEKSTVADTPTASANAATDPAAAQDRFLKLLVAQLNNQDPMNPLDNAQMTSQMAQINTVTGIQQLNQTMQGMAAQFGALQALQGASLIGHQVLTEGDRLAVTDGAGKGAFELAGAASDVKVDIVTPGGQVVGSVDLGAQAAGRQQFTWDASQYKGDASQLHFRVSASHGGVAVQSQPLQASRVVSTGMSNGVLTLGLEGGASVAYAQVKAIS